MGKSFLETIIKQQKVFPQNALNKLEKLSSAANQV